MEDDYLRIAAAIDKDPKRLVSACSVLETSIAISCRKGADAVASLELLLYKIEAQIIPYTRDQAVLAREGWNRFGKPHHPASLNFGDCCTYGLCVSTGEPLLFKGNDFTQTDLSLVSY